MVNDDAGDVGLAETLLGVFGPGNCLCGSFGGRRGGGPISESTPLSESLGPALSEKPGESL